MKAIVIAGGDVSSPAFYKPLVSDADLILCADSGYLQAKKIGITPHLVIGDFDSMEEACLPKDVQRVVLPVEKDETDLHTCIRYAIEQGATEILVFGGRGTRLDHSLAAISLAYMAYLKGVRVRLIDAHNELMVFSGEIMVQKREGYHLSLLPLTETDGIYTEGLYYPVDNGSMQWGNPYGVSNEFVAETAKIRVDSGVMLLILSRDDVVEDEA
ncbi:MAG: thiamine diphosphokinase [Ruminococcaceae bacterium]|nr:thiamine diphosphokinase [Oscillospiraceae bacterium]